MENELQYNISLQLDNISLQSLGWILKSIRNDQMTPSEKLILSRIKVLFILNIRNALDLNQIRKLGTKWSEYWKNNNILTI